MAYSRATVPLAVPPPAGTGVHRHEPRPAPEGAAGHAASGPVLGLTPEPDDFGQRLLEAQESERRAIARELHDDVTQRIAAAAMELAALLPRLHANPQAAAALGSLINRLRRLSTDVHGLSRSMHPHALETLGLSRALEGECAAFAQRTGLGMRTSIAPIGTGLPGATALAAFRIAQEALRNVEKHARATSVRVGLARTAHELRLTVSDTGIGFSPAAVARGIGLASMRERAAAMGASIVIKSSPGRGAEVRLLVPLTPPARLPALAPNPPALPGTRP